jgi:parallel beta-helix repeat protein
MIFFIKYYKMLFVMLLLLQYNSAQEIRIASSTNTVFPTWNYKCSSIKDDIIIQAALDSIAKTGGTVYLSDGLFTFSKNIDIKGNNIVLRGYSRDSTILKLKSKASKFAKAGFIRTKNTRYITISDMTLDGNNAQQATDTATNYGRYGIYTETCNYTTFTNLIVKNWYGYGLDPHGAGGIYAPGYYTTITNNLIINNAFDGITVDKTEYSTVSGNIIINNARHGINIVTGSKFTEIFNNQILDNGWWYAGKPGTGCGIMVQNNQGFDTRNANIYSNILTNSSRAGICLTDVENININNNQILNTLTCLRFKLMLNTNNIVIDPNNKCAGKALKDDSGTYTLPIVFTP